MMIQLTDLMDCSEEERLSMLESLSVSRTVSQISVSFISQTLSSRHSISIDLMADTRTEGANVNVSPVEFQRR